MCGDGLSGLPSIGRLINFKMEFTAYLVLAVFSFLIFLMSYYTDEWRNPLKILSGILLTGLGVMSLKLTYFMTNSTSYTAVTKNSESWQILLLIVFSSLGVFNIVLAFMDYFTERKGG